MERDYVLYIHCVFAYYLFLLDYPMFVYSGLSWTRIRKDCVKWRRWLDSDATKILLSSDFSFSSFWKGTLPAYRKMVEEFDQASIGSLDSLESNEEAIVNTHDQQKVISTGLAELNLQS
jgi:hypothetical protein